MAYSSYGLRIHGSRHDLLSQLVSRIVGVEADDENHGIALDFALQHAYYHSYPDPNPADVAAFYDGVERRLREDSQVPKAAALCALQLRALALPPAPDTPVKDHPWPFLALLASLAGRPLDSEFQETPELLSLLFQPVQRDAKSRNARQPGGLLRRAQQPAAGALQRRRLGSSSDEGGAPSPSCGSSGATSGGDIEDPFGCPSDLSDWGDGDEDETERCSGALSRQAGPTPAGEQLQAGAVAAAAAAQAGEDCAASTLSCWVAAPVAGAVAPAPELFGRRAVPLPGDLLPMLSSARLAARAPWLAPGPAHCYPQRALAAAALSALQGDAGLGFLLDPKTGGLMVDSRVTTPALSPRSLHALLQEFAEAGSAARALLHLARRLCSGAGEGGTGFGGDGDGGAAAPFGFPITPCLRAFGTALAEQLASQGAQLAALQHRLASQPAAPGNSRGSSGADADAGALAAARRAASGCILRLQLLQSVVGGLVNELGGTPAQTSASLLDCLYRRLASGDPALSGPSGEGAAGALLHLLLSSLMPLLGALGRWLYGGREGDGACRFGAAGDADGRGVGSGCGDDDFFISQVQQLPVQDPKFWSQAFVLSGGRPGTAEAAELAAAGPAAAGSGADSGCQGAVTAPGAAGAVAASCPSFLAPLAADILSAGKSLRLLRYMQQEELAAAPLQMQILEGGSCGEAAVGWQREDGQLPSRSRSNKQTAAASGATAKGKKQQRRGWQRGNGGAGAAAAFKQPLERLGDAGSSSMGVVRMSAAARMQLAVAAAAAQHGEDGEVFQLQFAEDACDLLRRWDSAFESGCGGAGGADSPGATCRARSCEGSGALQQLEGEGACAGSAQLLLPLWGSSCGAGGAWSGGVCGQVQQQQQRDMFEALDLAGQRLRCPGDLLKLGASGECGVAFAAGKQQLQGGRGEECGGDVGAAAVDGTLGKPPASAAICGRATSRRAGSGVATAAPAATTAGPTSAQGAAAAAADTPADAAARGSAAVGGGGVLPLAAWDAQLRSDMATVEARLLQLMPWCDDAWAAAAADRDDVNPQGSDGDDDIMHESCGPAEWPGELWPLRGRRRRWLRDASRACAGSGGGGGAGRGGGGGAGSCESGGLGGGGGSLLCSAAWLSAPLQPQSRLEWLLTDPPRFVGPVQMLLERALVEPLKERVDVIGSQLLGCLLGEWGLQAELRALAGTFLLASPSVVAWADDLLEAVERGGGLDGLDASELTMSLQELAASSTEEDPLPAPGSLVVSIDPAALEAARTARAAGQPAATGAAASSGGKKGASVAELGALQVRHLGSWLLSLVAEPSQLQSYNQALIFLLQLRWARRELDAARMRAAKSRMCAAAMATLDASERAAASDAAAARARHVASFAPAAAAAAAGSRAGAGAGVGGAVAAAGVAAVAAAGRWLGVGQEHLFLLEMGHLMGALQQYVMDRLMHGAWLKVEKGLAAATSLDEVRRCHATFQEAALRQCCQGGGRGRGATWRHIGMSLVQLMDVALRACRTHGRLLQLRRGAGRDGSGGGSGSGSGGVGGSGGGGGGRAAAGAGAGAGACQQQADAMASAAKASAALEVAALREELSQAAAAWRSGRSYLLRILRNKALQLGGDDEVEALLGALGFNAYYAE